MAWRPTLTIAAVVVAAGAVIALLVVAVTGMKRDQLAAREVDRSLVEEYCRLVSDGKFAEAYERCLSAGYRRQVAAADFVAAHEKRRTAVGSLQSRRLVEASCSRSLFSRARRFQLLFELQYPGGVERRHLVADDVDGVFRVEGTYTSSASGTLSFMLW
jgi:hypothetical protein